LCPSDFAGQKLTTMYQTNSMTNDGIKMPRSNYLCFFSGLNDGEGYSVPDPKKRAVFRYGRPTKIKEITDGTACTMAMGEYLRGSATIGEDVHGEIYTNRAGGQMLYVTNTPNSKTPDNFPGWWNGGCPTDGSRNLPSLNLPCVSGSDAQNYASPRSRHSGGV